MFFLPSLYSWKWLSLWTVFLTDTVYTVQCTVHTFSAFKKHLTFISESDTFFGDYKLLLLTLLLLFWINVISEVKISNLLYCTVKCACNWLNTLCLWTSVQLLFKNGEIKTHNVCENNNNNDLKILLFSAKPEQENLNELKQELDVDFHKVATLSQR